MTHFQKQLGIFIIFVALAGGILFFAQEDRFEFTNLFELTKSTEAKRVQIGNSVFEVELALTPEQRQQGLSGHKPLKDNEGMLFVFESPGQYSFWMKEMLFSLDILWINKDKRLVYIEPSLSPETFPKSFGPQEPTLYVLEINAGLSEKNNFKVGDKVKFLP